ncbi:MAG: hypothetical protein ICV69_11635 [Thermoleophilaceae bacterium]|nr:hypothetical protein [Thermoleophilaceae bacterium]
MKPQELALMFARNRIAFGIGFVLLPGSMGRLWIGDDAKRPTVKLLTRALGVRDLAIGLGTAIALDRGTPVRGWLEAAALSDAIDLVATLLASGSIPDSSRNVVAAIAGGSAVAGVALARALDEPPAPDEIEAPEAALTGHPPPASPRPAPGAG